MKPYLTRDQVLDHMQRKRAEWEALLAKVPAGLIEVPGDEGQWSVKDVIAHIAHYERWMAAFLESVARGEKPVVSELDRLELHARNARIYELNRDVPLDRVLAEARQSYQRLVNAVRGLEDGDFLPGSRFSLPIREIWGDDYPLAEAIGGDSFDHYDDHIAPLRAWLSQHGMAA